MTDDTEIAQQLAGQQIKESAEDIKNKAKLAGAAAWDATKATYQQMQSKAATYSKVTDNAIRSNPYVALGFAFCIGMLIGAFASRPKIVEKR